ncbi:TetR/AcrR family transcriptional regulator [Pseudactinotalea sp. Z1732]|uniref:TetR/AcrR family transcriptional regulator n=1 Tax=Micrococcales TaxID=85006 RepID=UPI003C7E92C0
MTSEGAPRTVGRPRDAQIDAAITAAAMELVREVGYLGVTLGEVAKRAGTSRPAIYRRYSGRAELILAAIEAHLEPPTAPDDGCTLCGIEESLTIFLSMFRTIAPEVFTTLYSECARDPMLRERYVRVAIEPSRRAVRTTLRRAVDRGHLREDVDIELLLDIIASLTHYRVLTGEHLSNVEAEQVVTVLLRGAAVDYDELLAHSMELERAQHATEPRLAEPHSFCWPQPGAADPPREDAVRPREDAGP